MSLKVKLPLVVTFIVLLSTFGVGYFFARHEQKMLREELVRRGELLSRQLAGVDPATFNLVAREAERLRTMPAEDTIRRISSSYQKVRVLSAALTEAAGGPGVLEASFFDWQGLPVLYLDHDAARDLIDNPETSIEALELPFSRHPDSIPAILGKPEDGFTFFSSILIGADTLGFAQIRLDSKVLDRAMNGALMGILPVMAGVLAASVVLSLLLSMLFTIPVSRLKEGALELAKGDLSARVKVPSHDELGVLGEVFNKMARNLERIYEELEEKLLEIKRLFKMATEDGLTGLYVKRYFLELLAGELRRSLRYERPLSLLMCDIDHFKQVNDTYGHQAGDEVLRAVSRRLIAATREGIDSIGRYGGEEFAVMLPETDEEDAWRVAERLRRSLESEPVRLDGPESKVKREVTVTISIGITTLYHETSMERLIEAADKALYMSKAQGRNRSTSLAVEVL